MEKIYGSDARQDSLIRVGRSYYMYYGFGRDGVEAGHGYNYRHKFDHRPSPDEIREQVLAAIDMETRERIFRGMSYEGYRINLSLENQLNYAMFRSMEADSVSIKVENTDGAEIIITFDKAGFADFYGRVQNHIKDCLQSCWNEKTSLDLSCYVV